MRNQTIKWSAAIIAISGLIAASTLQGDGVSVKKSPAPTLEVKSDPLNADWRSDPICQLVFFAVLEGLYTDGVPSAAVDLIVPKQTDDSVKHSFVFRCPLCHAAYEAFVLYQRRQGFNGSDEAASTFGDKFDRTIIEELKSKDVRTRVFAMGRLVQPWIDRRIKQMRLTEQEQAELMGKFLAYAEQGNMLFNQYRGDKNSTYFEWQFYGGCQACQAAINIAKKMNIDLPKKSQ